MNLHFPKSCKWNKLPNDCVNASSVDTFKKELTDI